MQYLYIINIVYTLFAYIKEKIMTKQEKIEIIFNTIIEKTNESEIKNKEIIKQSKLLLQFENNIKNGLPRNKIKELIKYSDQFGFWHITVLDYAIKLTIEFMLDFFTTM